MEAIMRAITSVPITVAGRRARDASVWASIARWVVAIRDYRRSLNELDALLDYELRDLGIQRDAIPTVAWEEARRWSELDAQAAPPLRHAGAAIVVAAPR